jgi:hypothetical protein
MAYIGNSPANVGNFQVVDDISSTFNGTLTSFALTALTLPINPAKSGQLLVSINGVLQEPDDTGTEGFLVSGSNIVFSSAPATGSTFWAVWQGQAVDIGTPSDGVVGTAQLSATGTKSGTTYLAGDNTWKTVVTDLVNDTTPQLGGDLDFQTHKATSFTSTGIDDNATSTAITIDASENVGIGTTTPTVALQVEDTDYHQIYAKGQSTVGGIRIGNSVYDNGFIYYDNGANMLFNTNGAERMRIDSAGRVTMPYQPAFRIKAAALTVSSTGYATAKFNDDTTTNCFDIGNNFNTSTYRFVAPVAGVYWFAANLRVDQTANYHRLMISKNGSTSSSDTLHSIIGNNISTNYQSFSVSGAISLSAGDYASAISYSDADTSWIIQAESNFSGYLIG